MWHNNELERAKRSFWAIGAAGAQVPYKHKAGGSNPSSPTTNSETSSDGGLFHFWGAVRGFEPRSKALLCSKDNPRNKAFASRSRLDDAPPLLQVDALIWGSAVRLNLIPRTCLARTNAFRAVVRVFPKATLSKKRRENAKIDGWGQVDSSKERSGTISICFRCS